jgi:hypothetical protein
MQKANNTKIKNVTTLEADNSVQLDIDLADKNYTVNGHVVESVTLYAEADCAGDLAVNWAYADADNTGYTESAMLMRNNYATDNVTETMQQFYWEHAFDTTLRKILADAGFSAAAVADVCTSEWGMQDTGRASYDAFCIAEEMLAAHNLVFADA